MPRTLLILRHAKSSWRLTAIPDHDRPLNRRGRRAPARLAAYLTATGECPDLVLCSTALRARETLALLLRELDSAPEVRHESGLYLAGADVLLASLRRVEPGWKRVMVVGHNPGLQALAVGLAAAADPSLARRMADKFPTGGLALLQVTSDWKALAPETVERVAFVTPRSLEASAS